MFMCQKQLLVRALVASCVGGAPVNERSVQKDIAGHTLFVTRLLLIGEVRGGSQLVFLDQITLF